MEDPAITRANGDENFRIPFKSVARYEVDEDTVIIEEPCTDDGCNIVHKHHTHPVLLKTGVDSKNVESATNEKSDAPCSSKQVTSKPKEKIKPALQDTPVSSKPKGTQGSSTKAVPVPSLLEEADAIDKTEPIEESIAKDKAKMAALDKKAEENARREAEKRRLKALSHGSSK